MLPHRDARQITLGGHAARLFLGQGPLALEVVHLELGARPTLTVLRELLKDRIGRRASPVLIVAAWGHGHAAVCGPTEHNAVELTELPAAQVEGIADKALDAENRHRAIRLIHQLLPQLDEPIPGLRNGGLFALHELQHGVPERGDWGTAAEQGRVVRGHRGRDLLTHLGYQVRDLPGPAMVLVARERKKAIAVLLDRPEEIDAASDRFDGVSPVSYALAQADRENLDYVLVLAGSTLRAYPAKPGVGSGRRGRSETFVEVNLDLLRDDQAGYLWLLFSAHALGDEGTFEEILGRSEDYAAELGRRLRERVYEEVVPGLATALGGVVLDEDPSQDELRHVFELALRVLYRLLFVAYAEDRDLLPLHASTVYREHSLKRMAQRLADAGEREVVFGDGDGLWTEVRQIWRAVSRGNPEWDVPPYNGSLFSADPETSPLGAQLDGLSLPDRAVAPALAALLLADTGEGRIGPVDFRSLGVREFGTIYEGLLESELSAAETDLRVDAKTGAYLPAEPDDEITVPAGGLYLHNQSGARKSTGSYYTKSFAVEHLLDRALEPAIDEHFERLSALSDREAGRRFFEFRVADIAMGSGHFLVAAVDRIERRFVSYLAERPLPEVKAELNRLRSQALGNLGEDWAGDAIEDAQLIRRQIARRCVFGVDLNPMAVELARVSLWIHTFVPGLPLSLMDQNLVQGNSLVGIATFEEASELLQADTGNLFSFVASERLAGIREPLERLARLTDANDAEIREARDLYQRLVTSTKSEADLLTVLTASRTNQRLHEAVAQGQVATRPEDQGNAFWRGLVDMAEEELEGLDVLHFPLAFPHVFLGDRKGFDVILGNPPWEKPMLEEHAYWARFFPGLRGVTQREREVLTQRYRDERPDLCRLLEIERAAADRLRGILSSGAFPGMTSGHPDLYKAFVWRFWDLVAPDGGRVGVVLPRSALAAKGSGDFRKAMLGSADVVDLTMLLNNRQWVFEEVHPQYTIGLAVITRRAGPDTSRLLLSGPYTSLERFQAGVVREPVTFTATDVADWNDDASFPLLPSEESAEVFAQLRRQPRLDLDEPRTWRARPIQGDLNATGGKDLMDLESERCPEGYWPVFKGESFDLWTPDTGTYYAWADPGPVLERLGEKRARANKRSAFSEFPPRWRNDPATEPCLAPRIAFRDVTRATDTRTVRTALIPPNVVLVHTAPYLVFPRGDETDVTYLLGVLSSVPLDWYARRFVETHLTFFVLNPFPIPRPGHESQLRRRVTQLAGRLASPDDRFAEWAASVGVKHGPLATNEKEDMIHELDAVVAHLYGLSESHLRHIFETFHEGWDYEDRLRETLRHFQTWRGRA